MKKIVLIILFFLSNNVSFSQKSFKQFYDFGIHKMENYFCNLVGKNNYEKYVRLNRQKIYFIDKNKKGCQIKDTAKFKNPIFISFDYNFIEGKDTIYTSSENELDTNLNFRVFDDLESFINNRKEIESCIIDYKKYFDKKIKFRYNDLKKGLLKKGYQNDSLKIEDICITRDTTANEKNYQNVEYNGKYYWRASIWKYRLIDTYNRNSIEKRFDWSIFKLIYFDTNTGKLVKEEEYKPRELKGYAL